MTGTLIKLTTVLQLALVAVASANAQVTIDPMSNPDKVITEEQFAATRINYLAPPEIIEAYTELDQKVMRFHSEIELAATLADVNRAVDRCITLRETLEPQIGTRAGSYSVHTHWVKAYQNCLMQRRADLNVFGDVLQTLYVSTIESGGGEGATTLTALIDRLRSRHSTTARRLDQEMKLQKQFVTYYNTGVKTY